MDSDQEGSKDRSNEDSPSGWVGGDIVHTGGNIRVREWIHPDKGLLVGYSLDDPTVVGVESVQFTGDGEQSNPLLWDRVDKLSAEPCDGEEDCFDTAQRVMENYGKEDIE